MLGKSIIYILKVNKLRHNRFYCFKFSFLSGRTSVCDFIFRANFITYKQLSANALFAFFPVLELRRIVGDEGVWKYPRNRLILRLPDAERGWGSPVGFLFCPCDARSQLCSTHTQWKINHFLFHQRLISTTFHSHSDLARSHLYGCHPVLHLGFRHLN